MQPLYYAALSSSEAVGSRGFGLLGLPGCVGPFVGTLPHIREDVGAERCCSCLFVLLFFLILAACCMPRLSRHCCREATCALASCLRLTLPHSEPRSSGGWLFQGTCMAPGSACHGSRAGVLHPSGFGCAKLLTSWNRCYQGMAARQSAYVTGVR